MRWPPASSACFVRAIGGAGAADLCLRRAGARSGGAGRVSEDLSVSAECAVARRRAAACDGGQSAWHRPRANSVMPHRPGSRAAGAGAGRRVGEHGIRCGRGRGGGLRFPRHRPARLEGRTGARSAIAGRPEYAGHASRKAEVRSQKSEESRRRPSVFFISAASPLARARLDLPGASVSGGATLGSDRGRILRAPVPRFSRRAHLLAFPPGHRCPGPRPPRASASRHAHLATAGARGCRVFHG